MGAVDKLVTAEQQKSDVVAWGHARALPAQTPVESPRERIQSCELILALRGESQQLICKHPKAKGGRCHPLVSGVFISSLAR